MIMTMTMIMARRRTPLGCYCGVLLILAGTALAHAPTTSFCHHTADSLGRSRAHRRRRRPSSSHDTILLSDSSSWSPSSCSDLRDILARRLVPRNRGRVSLLLLAEKRDSNKSSKLDESADDENKNSHSLLHWKDRGAAHSFRPKRITASNAKEQDNLSLAALIVTVLILTGWLTSLGQGLLTTALFGLYWFVAQQQQLMNEDPEEEEEVGGPSVPLKRQIDKDVGNERTDETPVEFVGGNLRTRVSIFCLVASLVSAALVIPPPSPPPTATVTISSIESAPPSFLAPRMVSSLLLGIGAGVVVGITSSSARDPISKKENSFGATKAEVGDDDDGDDDSNLRARTQEEQRQLDRWDAEFLDRSRMQEKRLHDDDETHQ